MKYANYNLIIPEGNRERLNNKILQLLESGNTQGISNEDIFNTYTGIGGLHGLDPSDYHHYAQFADAKKEYENGQFFTSPSLCQYIIELLQPGHGELIADLTCGIGTFFNYCPVESNCYGLELDPNAYKVAKFLYPQANIDLGDLQYHENQFQYDIVIGNPPFNLSWSSGLSQLVYCKKAAAALKPGGLMAIITPLSFMSDDFSNKGQIESIEEDFNFIGQIRLPVNSFRHLGIQNFRTKLLLLQRRSEHLPLVKIAPEAFISFEAPIYQEYILPVKEVCQQLKAKLLNETQNTNEGNNWSFAKRNYSSELGFHYRVKKYLYEIGTHPLLRNHLSKAEQYLQQYNTQSKPEDLTWQEWDKKKLTERKVLSYLKKIIALQIKKPSIDRIRLVKQNYGLKIKGDSPKTRNQVSKLFENTYFPFYDLVQYPESQINTDLLKRFPGISTRLINKKKKQFSLQSHNLDSMDRNLELDQYLSAFTFVGKGNQQYHLNTTQINDLGLMFQKNYGSLNWEQGSGKTIAGYTFAKWHLLKSNIRNVYIIGPAIAITATWIPFLNQQGESFIETRSRADIEKISPGNIVLVPLSMIAKYQRDLKRAVRTSGQKIAMIFDESDEITNPRATRTRATLNIFRKAKYKLETTGTTTRNNINEWYSQLELLYNNSFNMICTAKFRYREDKKDLTASDDGIIQLKNDHYMKPFPAYKGFNLFRSSFNPFKKTVFGIEKQNQDIFNQDSLLTLITKTVITRKFKEVAGDGKYTIHNVKVNQNQHEETVYKKILDEFHELERKYCKSTGNSRKDAMLRLIKQINLLIKATSMPHTFNEYEFDNNQVLPTKFYQIFQMIEVKNDQKFMIGTTRKDSATAYYQHISRLNPFRKIWLVTGDTDIRKRKAIVKEFEESFNGILISTQQSLKSSVNIPSCNNVIVESLQWNIPKISQYYFRAIRYDSENHTNVYFITYEHTLEQNIMALLMSKEAINDFIKNRKYTQFNDVLTEFDVDPNLLSSIITKTYDNEGKMHLNWGKQKAS